MNLINPKVILFFIAFFPAFLFSNTIDVKIQFAILGSLISRNHVLQKWMELNYFEFSNVILFFSSGAVLSNLLSSSIL